MLEFIQLLKQRYQTVFTQLDKKSPLYFEYQQRIEQLLYAEAYIRKGRLIEDKPAFPLQIAVIGPTQAGKSSMVNFLLNHALADVSPLAGYTVHAQGFCHQLAQDACNGMQYYFGRFQGVTPAELTRNRFDCYAISPSATRSRLLPACVIWDTPDFDSIDAVDYREGVIRTLALADLVILVVSKEKYADQSVWELMQTIAAFKQPTLICLNKLAEDSERLVLESLKQKWLHCRKDPVPPVIPMLFQKTSALPDWSPEQQQHIFHLSKQVQPEKHLVRQQQFIQQFWQQWLEPIRQEHQAQQHWQALIDQCLEQASMAYRRDFLDHPHHYHTFQAALVNLLDLLEIPSLAGVLSKTRRYMTWPIRKLMAWGKGDFSVHTNQEISVLNQIGEHVMIQLADKLLENTETASANTGWWRETAIIFRQARPSLLQEYQQAVSTYHSHFQQNIESAARQLYTKLEEHPMLLNSLRATRFSTDAGALVLAIHAGGVGLHDLLITPIMLSITSLLAESAIGSYMQRIAAELKQNQLQTVEATLFQDSLRARLYSLPQQSRSSLRFNISIQQCLQAEQALKEKKHGLRIL